MPESRRHVVRLSLSAAELEQLERFCAERRVKSRAEGARTLLLRGLKTAGPSSQFAQMAVASRWVN